MDAFRKQLDALMGANRNGDVEEVQLKYYEKDVCRPYLCGLCPHELFQLTVRAHVLPPATLRKQAISGHLVQDMSVQSSAAFDQP